MHAEMRNPSHPGEILQEWIEGLNLSVTEFAKHIHVARGTLSKVLNGRAGVSAEMSQRLSAALGTNPGFWFDMQCQYDFAQSRRRKLPKIERIVKAA